MKRLYLPIFICGIFFIAGCNSTKQENVSIQKLIKDGKYDEAKSFFISKVDINSQDEEGNTVLHSAVMMNDADMVTFLLIKGADKEIKNFSNQTPLILAIEEDKYESAKALTDFNADVFTCNSENISALELALSKNEIYFDIMINEKTAKLHDIEGRTIIHHFVLDKNENALSYAIKQNLPIDEKDKNGETPLALAEKDPSSPVNAKMAALLLLGGAKATDGDLSYFEQAVIARNYSITMRDGQTPLHIASIYNHTGIASYLLENNASTSSQDINGSTPLHEACRYGNTNIVSLLLDHKADVNGQDSLCKTPIELIIPEENRIEIYKLLLSHNADVNHKDMYGDTVLHTGAMLNLTTDELSILCESGADVNIRNKKGYTALATSIENNVKSHVEFFVNHGADIHAEDSEHKTPLLKTLNSDDGLFEAIITKENVNTVDSEGNTPLIIAIANDASKEKITHLLALGCNVNACNRKGNSALYYAVEKNNKEIGLDLIEKNANIFSANTAEMSPLKLALTTGKSTWLINSKTIISKDGSGNSVLHYAADWNLINAIDFLIKKGAVIDSINSNGQTPLFFASRADNTQVIDKLISCGANINARDNLGSTVLHTAIRWNAVKSAKKFINLGIDINHQDVSGKTALAEAAIGGNTELTQLLLSLGANPNIYDTNGKTAIVDAIRANQKQTVTLLLNSGANPQIQDMNGRTPYHEACETGDLEMISILRKAHGNPLNRDKEGNTPLSICFSKGDDFVNAVLGTNKNITDSDGNTPVHIAVSNKASLSSLENLIKKGFPFDTRNSSGATPLALAVKENKKDYAIVLLENGASPFAEINNSNVITLVLTQKNEEILNNIAKYSGNKTDIQGNSILHYAAKFGDASTVKNLLAKGLNKSLKNITGETPYDVALSWEHKDIANLLK